MSDELDNHTCAATTPSALFAVALPHDQDHASNGAVHGAYLGQERRQFELDTACRTKRRLDHAVTAWRGR